MEEYMAREMIEAVRAAEQRARSREQQARQDGDAAVRQAQEEGKRLVEAERARATEEAARLQEQAEADIARLVMDIEKETELARQEFAARAKNNGPRAVEALTRQVLG